MTDGELLLAIFAGFYLIECLHWLPLGCVVFKSGALLRSWQAVRPSTHLATQEAGLALAWPLPLLGHFLVAQPWVIYPDEEGFFIAEGHPGAGRRLLWAEVKVKTEQCHLDLQPGLRVRCATKRAAIQLRDFITNAQSVSAKERHQLVESWWQESLSLPRARAAVRRYRTVSAALRWPCLMGFFLCFLYLPWLFWFFGGGMRAVLGFVSLLLLNILTATTWRALDRRLHPADKSSRWGQMLHLILMPAHTLRALDLLGVDALPGIHPLAAAGVILAPEARLDFASQLWRKWRYRSAQDPFQSLAPQMLARIESCCQSQGLTREDLSAAPDRTAGAASYCPQCLTQFNAAEATCEQCGHLKTVAWEVSTPD